MNQGEFNTFMGDFEARFPEDHAWLASHPRTMQLWQSETFNGLALSDVMEVSKRITRGELEPWKAYERSLVPAFYLRECRRMQTKRNDAEAETRKRRQGSPRGILADADANSNGPSMVAALAKLQEMRKKGSSERERKAFLDEYFTDDPADQRRYKCALACENGWLPVWHPDTIKAAVVDADAVKNWKTVLVRCTCGEGRNQPGEFRAGPRHGKQVPTFGDRRWHIRANTPSAKADAAAYEHKPEGYNDAFQDFEGAA